MKSSFLIYVFYILIALFTITPNIACYEYGYPKVDIPDDHLEAALRKILNKPTGDIYQYELEKLQWLNFRDEGIVNLEGLEYCKRLKEIDLTGNSGIVSFNPLLDIEGLIIHFDIEIDEQFLDPEIRKQTEKPEGPLSPSDLAKVKVLSGFVLHSSDIKYPELLTGLEELKCHTGDMINLRFFAHLRSLKKLSISGPQPYSYDNPNISGIGHKNKFFNDFSPLSNLTNLSCLSICNSEHLEVASPDFSPLANLTNLTHLCIFIESDFDLAPLSGLNNLEELNLYENHISDISPLRNLTNLKILRLSDHQLTNIDAIASMHNLEVLQLECFYIESKLADISPLAGLTKLSTLTLSGPISDFSALSKMPSLKNLELYNTDITDLDPIMALKNLSNLTLSRNHKLINLYLLADIKGLGSLDLYGLETTDLDFLSGLTNLKTLYISFSDDLKNKKPDLSPIWNLSGLTELSICNTKIPDLKPILKLINLKYLALSYCDLGDIRILDNMRNLESLTIFQEGDFDKEPVEKPNTIFKNIHCVIIPSLGLLGRYTE